MDKIIIGDFYIQEYDESNKEHKATMILLSNQEDSIYRGDLSVLEADFKTAKEKGKKDAIYIAYLGDVPVGMVGGYSFFERFYLMYSILPEFRGHYYSSRLALEYARYFFREHPEIDAVYAAIDSSDLASIKNINKAGFQRLGDSDYILRRC